MYGTVVIIGSLSVLIFCPFAPILALVPRSSLAPLCAKVLTWSPNGRLIAIDSDRRLARAAEIFIAAETHLLFLFF